MNESIGVVFLYSSLVGESSFLKHQHSAGKIHGARFPLNTPITIQQDYIPEHKQAIGKSLIFCRKV